MTNEATKKRPFKTLGIRLVCGALLVLSLGICRPLAADQDTAAARFVIAAAVVAAQGYNDTRFVDFDRVPAGYSFNYPVVLNRGVKYMFFAVRDQNIDVLELFIADEDGTIVARGSAGEWGASVSYTPPWSGSYRAYVHNSAGRTGFYGAALVF